MENQIRNKILDEAIVAIQKVKSTPCLCSTQESFSCGACKPVLEDYVQAIQSLKE